MATAAEDWTRLLNVVCDRASASEANAKAVTRLAGLTRNSSTVPTFISAVSERFLAISLGVVHHQFIYLPPGYDVTFFQWSIT